MIRQCVTTEGVEAEYIKTEVLAPFFMSFWVVRNALDRRNAKEVIDTTVEIANKVSAFVLCVVHFVLQNCFSSLLNVQ